MKGATKGLACCFSTSPCFALITPAKSWPVCRALNHVSALHDIGGFATWSRGLCVDCNGVQELAALLEEVLVAERQILHKPWGPHPAK